MNKLPASICFLLVIIFYGCVQNTPSEETDTVSAIQTVEGTDQVSNEVHNPNVFLTFAYDQYSHTPEKNTLTILLNGGSVNQIYKDGGLNLNLDPGTYDLQVKSGDPRAAMRRSIVVVENQKFEELIFLKSEALSLLGDSRIRILGIDETGIVDPASNFELVVFDSKENLVPFDTLSMVMITPIEPNTFTDQVGGTDSGDSKFITDKFTLHGARASFMSKAEFSSLLNQLEAGQYELEVSIYDSVNDLSYEDVLFLQHDG